MGLKTSKELTIETVKLINKFKTKQLVPISTGISHLDDALLGGLLPGTVVGIVARSQHGKTYDSERITRHIMNNNKDIIYINCNWEMSHFKLLIRDIAIRTGDSYKSVLFDEFTEAKWSEFKEICDIHRVENVLYQNEPVSSEVFKEDINSIIEANPSKKIVVCIDNLENILRSGGSQKDCMDALLYEINVLKNKHYFISFVILNQMNQNYVLRIDDNRKQFPNEGDIYGTDQLLKLCDVLYVKVIPWKLGIKEKFLWFPKGYYEWLEEYKLLINNKKTSFDPFGTAFYFYLKQRQPEDERNIKDLFIEKMFSRSQSHINVKEEPVDMSNLLSKGFDDLDIDDEEKF